VPIGEGANWWTNKLTFPGIELVRWSFIRAAVWGADRQITGHAKDGDSQTPPSTIEIVTLPDTISHKRARLHVIAADSRAWTLATNRCNPAMVHGLLALSL
jgi:hypothetical protein